MRGWRAPTVATLATVAALAVARAGAADGGGVRLADPFADGAVLQRGRRVPVWGTAAPGETVTVTFAGQSVAAVADARGDWRVDLAPLDACADGRVLTARGRAADAAAVARDVLVGEVWFCAGQSNAELPLVSENPRFRDAKGAMRAQLTVRPLIRYCRMSDYRTSPEPRRTCRFKPAWRTFTPENLGREPSFSAMGVYFALELHAALGVPVGLVGAWWGGTGIAPWTPKSGLLSVPQTRAQAAVKPLSHEAFHAVPKERRRFLRVQSQPGVLWNEMVAPWTPYALRGFIWYQGCNNIADGPRYTAKMHALYNGWAKEFENDDLRLRFVQLAPMGDERIAAIQMAQARFAAEEPRAKMAVINDVGNLFDCHPNDKETVGQRLALLALKHDYGFSHLVADSPVPRTCRAEGGRLIVEFDHAAALYVYNPDGALTAGLEVAGADGVWKPGAIRNLAGDKGLLDGARLVVSADGVPAPVRVRYLHSRPWTGSLYNEGNLPVGAFEIAVE